MGSNPIPASIINAAKVHMGEQFIGNEWEVGSIPTGGSTFS